MVKENYAQSELWKSTDMLYRAFRENTDMESARGMIAVRLERMAHQIKTRTVTPDGHPVEEDDSVIE